MGPGVREFARARPPATRPAGPERVRAHEAALRLAQAHGSFAEEFVARLDLTQALLPACPGPAQTSCTSPGCAGRSTRTRGLVQDDRDAVLWRLKWAVDLIEDIPEVGLDALVAAIDDVEQVFRADGYHLRPVHAARARLAQRPRRPTGARRELAAWLAEPRDSRSDCQACELREQARLVAERRPGAGARAGRAGRRGRAHLRRGAARAACRWTPSCGWTAGDVDGAVASFRRAWHLAQDDPGAPTRSAPACGCCCAWATPTGPSTCCCPGWGGSTSCATPRERMWFAATAAHVLDRAAAVGLAPDEGRRPAGARGRRRAAPDCRRAWPRPSTRRYGSTVTSATLAAAHDAAPGCPPSRRCRRPGCRRPARVRQRRRARCRPRPACRAGRRCVRDGLAAVDADLEPRCAPGCATATAAARWRRRSSGRPCRCSTGPAPRTPGPRPHRALLELGPGRGAPSRRRRPPWPACEGELALLDAAEAYRDRRPVVRPRGAGARAAPSGSRRAAPTPRPAASGAGSPGSAAPTTRPATLVRAAAAYERAGQSERRLLCGVEAGDGDARPRDPARAAARLDALEAVVGRPPGAARRWPSTARGRIARGTGDPSRRRCCCERGLAVRGMPRRTAARRARRAVRRAGRPGGLGRSRGPGGRPRRRRDAGPRPRAARLRPALPRPGLRRDRPPGRGGRAARGRAAGAARARSPALVGPVGWALGNALLGSASGPRRARRSRRHPRPSRPRDGSRRPPTRSGGPATRPGRPGTTTPRPATSTPPSTRPRAPAPSASTSRRCGRARRCAPTPGTWPAGSPTSTPRSRPASGWQREAGAGEEEFDAEVLEPHVLRQGAHLLARHGEVDEAVERLAPRRGPRRCRARAGAARRGGHRARRRRPARGGRAAAARLARRAAGRRARRRTGRRRGRAGPGPGPGRPGRGGRGRVAAARRRTPEAVRRRRGAARGSPRPGRARPAPAPSSRARGSSPPGPRGCRSRR